MPTTARTIRVFISSTFSDLKAERNALQERVFPRLKCYCQSHGWAFQAIDLRWGISHEAALDQNTMRICQAEIARCQAVTPRPNFVVLLGDRHGWRPLPDEISAAEFEALLPHLPAAMAKRWYQLDENAVCPLPDGTGLDKGLYVLQPRIGEFEDYDKWFAEVEGPLGDGFRRAAREVGLPEDARLKYEASATAQEIHDGAFAVPDAREHVAAFIREIRMADGRPLREALPDQAGDFVDLKQGELDRESQDQLDALKQKLRDQLGRGRIRTYPARWEGNGTSPDHLPGLCADVLRSLGRLIHAQIKNHSALPPLEEERLRHQEFAQRRARDFTGQAGPLGELERYLAPTSEPVTPLVVHGASGSGKSALLAKAVEAVAGGKWPVAGANSPKSQATARPSTLNSQPSTLLYRFIGATANSTDPRSLLEGLCRELGERYGADNRDVPQDLNKLTVVFRQRLALATAEQPLTLFLDALDQLQASNPSVLSWLPDKLPVHVRLVVSVIPGQMLDALISHLPSARFLELGPMRAEDAGELLQKWLQRAGRRLAREEQRQAIREGFTRCALPLYLRLAFEEAQRWRSYDQPPPPSPDVDGLIERLFSRLSAPANHGPLLVEGAVSYLRCSQHGLSEDETLDLLANDAPYWEHFRQSAQHALPETDGQQTRRLPVVIWSRLYHDLEPYLSWRSANGTALMVFFHTRFNEVADRLFLRDDTVRSARHGSLATYFRDLADPERNQTWKGDNARPFLQVVFHLVRAQRTDDYCQTLCDLRFVEARCRVEQVFELIADYRLAQKNLPEAQADLEEERRRRERITRYTSDLIAYAKAWSERRDRIARGERVSEPEPEPPTPPPSCRMWTEAEIETECQRIIGTPKRLDRLRAFAGFVESQCYRLIEFGKHSGFVPQHAFSTEPAGLVHDASVLLLAALKEPHLLRDWPPNAVHNPKPACLRTLAGHRVGINSVSVTPEGGRAVSGGADHTLRVWDLESGVCLRTLEGHSDGVNSVSVTQDGRRIVSGGNDGMVRVWDVESGTCLRTLEGHSGWVHSVSVTAHGQHAVSTDYKTLRVWDLETGVCLQAVEAHSKSASVTADGRCAVSAGWDETLRVWNLESGACLRIMEGHNSAVRSLSVTAHGRRAVSASDDKTLRVWDLESGICLRTLEGHSGCVLSVSVAPDGRRAVSASQDYTLRVWDVESGACLRTLKGHNDVVKSVSVTPDGRRAVSASFDKTLRVWDVESGACLRTLGGHSEWVTSVSVTPDGRRAVSASFDKTVRVWDVETGTCVRTTLEGHSDEVASVSVTPDGRRAISAGWDKTVRVWDVESGACLRTIEGHSGWVRSVSVTPDGRRAVSGSSDSTLRVWDLESGVCLVVFCAAAPVSATATFLGRLVVGMHTGEVLFAEIRNIPSGAAILTAAKPQQARCPMCGQEFAPPPAVVAAIQDQSANQNSKSGILSHCPHCQHSLQFNPFFSDAEDYAEVLRRGLEFSRREKGNDHEETLAHLAALAAHLEKTGKSPEARALAEERDRLAAYRSKDAKS